MTTAVIAVAVACLLVAWACWGAWRAHDAWVRRAVSRARISAAADRTRARGAAETGDGTMITGDCVCLWCGANAKPGDEADCPRGHA
jgi:hypothetical protein